MKRKWWQDKVAYQIYPKSFCDSNGDGIGDLRGIIGKLDYLKELGVDIVWISPVYKSPFVDQGYDIADYYAIDPVFGTMDDMDELIAEAKKRDMYILMDLVINHCSDQHEWFQKAIADPYGPYGDYFYFEKGRDGHEPTNWRSYFTGPAWDKVPGQDDLYYLHMFAAAQPDLNWENPEVREEIYKMINWWMDKGIAGFRLDAIINVQKELPFRDYPADRADGSVYCIEMLKKTDGALAKLHELNDKTFAKKEAFTIGELCDYKDEDLEKYVGEDGCFETIFDFSSNYVGFDPRGWYACRPITPDQYRDITFASKKNAQKFSYLANIIENHDEPRGVSRYIPEGDLSDRSKKLLAGIQFMNFGLPFLFQGQEIGMTNLEFHKMEDVEDISTLGQIRDAIAAGLEEEEAIVEVCKISRDNSRSPMQWTDGPSAGFTTGTPWYRVNDNYREINVADQIHRADSVFAFYQEMIALRKNPAYKESVVYGEMIPFGEDVHNLFAFYRKPEEGPVLLVLANYQKEARKVTIPHQVNVVLVDNCRMEQDSDAVVTDDCCVEQDADAVECAQNKAPVITEDLDGNSVVEMAGYQFLVLEVR